MKRKEEIKIVIDALLKEGIIGSSQIFECECAIKRALVEIRTRKTSERIKHITKKDKTNKVVIGKDMHEEEIIYEYTYADQIKKDCIKGLTGITYPEWVHLKIAMDRMFEQKKSELEKELKFAEPEVLQTIIHSQFG